MLIDSMKVKMKKKQIKYIASIELVKEANL